jgi:hypothetical protein
VSTTTYIGGCYATFIVYCKKCVIRGDAGMGLGEGFIKYMIFTPLTIVGFISMYIFGGMITTFFNTVLYLLAGNFLEAFLEYFVTNALPPTSITHVIFQVAVGTFIAGSKWLMAMTLIGR